MRTAQFVSPIIILAIIMLSTYIIIAKNEVSASFAEGLSSLLPIINTNRNITIMDLEYQNSLTTRTLELASTIKGSGTITNVIQQEYGADVSFNAAGILISYAKTYETGTSKKTINNIITVPYPYSGFLNQEERFSTASFKTCLGIEGCAKTQECTDNYDVPGTYDWELKYCEMGPPLKVRINITADNYPLTGDYPYATFNNTLITIE